VKAGKTGRSFSPLYPHESAGPDNDDIGDVIVNGSEDTRIFVENNPLDMLDTDPEDPLPEEIVSQ
jgi:hypothetical protein